MTEHRRIPLPEEEREVRSLFERAMREWGQGGFRPAPLPHDLAPPPMKRARVKGDPHRTPAGDPREPAEDHVSQGGTPPGGDAPFAAPVPAPSPVETAPVAANQPSNTPAQRSSVTLEQMGERPVRFSGPTQPIDRKHLRDQGLIVPEGAVSALLEEFRIVKRQLLVAARDTVRTQGTGAGQRVLICSPLPGEGKTFCAVNLSLAIAAEKDSEVVLIDADVAKPSVLSALGLPGGQGLMDALTDPSLKVEDLVIPTDIPGLYVLPAGNQTGSDSEFLASARTADVLGRLTRGAPGRMLIFDSPPALAASPAAELAKYCSQAVLVARADRTGQNALEDAYQLLSACPDIKLLLNAAHFSPSGRKFGSYYGYGG